MNGKLNAAQLGSTAAGCQSVLQTASSKKASGHRARFSEGLASGGLANELKQLVSTLQLARRHRGRFRSQCRFMLACRRGSCAASLLQSARRIRSWLPRSLRSSAWAGPSAASRLEAQPAFLEHPRGRLPSAFCWPSNMTQVKCNRDPTRPAIGRMSDIEKSTLGLVSALMMDLSLTCLCLRAASRPQALIMRRESLSVWGASSYFDHLQKCPCEQRERPTHSPFESECAQAQRCPAGEWRGRRRAEQTFWRRVARLPRGFPPQSARAVWPFLLTTYSICDCQLDSHFKW